MAGATPAYIDIRATIMEHDKTTTAFSRLQQSASPSVATNYNGGAALMDIGAINKGKGKGKSKGKGKTRKRQRKERQQRKGLRTTRLWQRKRARWTNIPTQRIQQLYTRKRKRTRKGNRQRKRIHNRLLQMWSARPHGTKL